MSDVLEKTKVKPLEDRFGDFLIRYEVQMADVDLACAISADVYDVAEWKDGTPIFFHSDGPLAFSKGPITDLNHPSVKPLFTILAKWDGCTHLHMHYLHFDGLERFDKFADVVRYIYNDVCARHDVGD